MGLLLVAAAVGGGLALLSMRKADVVVPVELPAPPAVAQDLAVLDAVTPFTLTNANGVALGLDQFAGKVWTANLFFTSCKSICPLLTRHLAKLQTDVGPDVPFDLLSVSVDPAHDTLPVLAEFAAEYGADTNRWHFATATHAEVQALASESLHLGAPDEPINHSPYVVLIDRDGQIRGYYDGLDLDALSRLATDIRRLGGKAPAAAHP